MSNRLVSLLSEIEQALVANDPAPDGGSWSTSRLINFQQGLARLTLSVRTVGGVVVPRGTILLQQFVLADDTQCLKANLKWAGSENSMVCAIYSKPDVNWHSEASQIATKWQDGQLAVVVPTEPVVADAPAVDRLVEATG